MGSRWENLNLGSEGWYAKMKGWESGEQMGCRIVDCVEDNVMYRPPLPPTPSVCVFFSLCQSSDFSTMLL